MGNNNDVDVMVHNALQKEAPYTGLPQADYMEAPRGEIGDFYKFVIFCTPHKMFYTNQMAYICK